MLDKAPLSMGILPHMQNKVAMFDFERQAIVMNLVFFWKTGLEICRRKCYATSCQIESMEVFNESFSGEGNSSSSSMDGTPRFRRSAGD
jgi:hypothetical protein